MSVDLLIFISHKIFTFFFFCFPLDPDTRLHIVKNEPLKRKEDKKPFSLNLVESKSVEEFAVNANFHFIQTKSHNIPNTIIFFSSNHSMQTERVLSKGRLDQVGLYNN